MTGQEAVNAIKDAVAFFVAVMGLGFIFRAGQRLFDYVWANRNGDWIKAEPFNNNPGTEERDPNDR